MHVTSTCPSNTAQSCESVAVTTLQTPHTINAPSSDHTQRRLPRVEVQSKRTIRHSSPHSPASAGRQFTEQDTCRVELQFSTHCMTLCAHVLRATQHHPPQRSLHFSTIDMFCYDAMTSEFSLPQLQSHHSTVLSALYCRSFPWSQTSRIECAQNWWQDGLDLTQCHSCVFGISTVQAPTLCL